MPQVLQLEAQVVQVVEVMVDRLLVTAQTELPIQVVAQVAQESQETPELQKLGVLVAPESLAFVTSSQTLTT